MIRSPVSVKNIKWVQVLIVAGVLLASIFLAITASRAHSPAEVLLNPVMLLLVAAGVTVLLIVHPVFGLALLIILCLISLSQQPILSVYFTPSLGLVFLLLALWVLERIVVRRRFDLILARPFLPLALLVIAVLISFGVGQLRWFAFARPAPLTAQLAGMALFVLSAGVFFLAAHQIQDLIWLKRLTWIFIGICAIYILIRLLPGDQSELIWRIFTKATSTSIFWIWMVAVAFSQGLFNKELKIHWRIFLVLLTAAALVVALIISYSWKSGWMPPLIAILVILYLRSPKLGIAATVVALVIILAKDLPSSIIQSDQYSYTTRLAAWNIVLEKIYRVSPIFGLGPANYRFYTPLFSIMGYNVLFNSHNNYIDLLAQIGVVGLGMFLWFFFEVFRLGWQLWKRVPEGFAQAYVVGALAGLTATLASGFLGDWIIPYVYNVGIHGFQGTLLAWFFLGGMVALARILKIEGYR